MLKDRHALSLELDKVISMLEDRTTCAPARALAAETQPLSSFREASGALKQTLDAHMLLGSTGGPSFSGLEDISGSIARAQAGAVLTTRELLSAARDLRVVRGISEWRSAKANTQTVLDIYFNSLMPDRFLENAISTAIISEEEISDSASPELRDIRRKIAQKTSSIREKLDGMTRSEHYRKFLQESIITQRGGRYVVPVKAEHRGEIPGIVHDTSSSGATVFIEPMSVVEANNDIRELQAKERDEIERILEALSSQVAASGDNIKAGVECAAELDLIFARARLAFEMNAHAEIITDDGVIDLRGARHPLISKDTVVPVSIRLGSEFDTLVITGPNTGGKTVSIKTLGLLVLMARCGLMIPAEEGSRVSFFDNVYADIGDEQSIEQSLSTFSSHMVNIKDILDRTSPENEVGRSLALIDELGAGTDPVEGAALAMAILEKLREHGCLTAATTHYAELKAYALDTPGVENACCEFDVETLRPTYRLLIGMPGRSNAFAISEKLGLSPDVIDRAKELVSTENIRFEDVYDSLERRRADLEKTIAEAQADKEAAQKALAAAEKAREEAVKTRESETAKAREQAARIAEKARRESAMLSDEIDRVRRELRSGAADAEALRRELRQATRKAVGEISEAADPVSALPRDENYILPRPLRKGDKVILADYGLKGEVLAPADSRGLVSVRAGTANMRVSEKSLRLEEQKPKRREESAPAVRTGDFNSRVNAPARMECDIRGFDTEQGVIEVDAFIDQAVMSGLKEMTVIHGKGTGALRAAVQKHLRTHPQVKSFRLGSFGEGEDGVTVVNLK